MCEYLKRMIEGHLPSSVVLYVLIARGVLLRVSVLKVQLIRQCVIALRRISRNVAAAAYK